MKMKNYQIETTDTYIYLIKENLLLIKGLIDKEKNKTQPFNPNNTKSYYQNRAKHLQSMTFIGLTCEHLLKLIILNRGYSIYIVDSVKKTEKNKVKVNYSNRTVTFESLIHLFKKTNTNGYFEDLKTYEFNDPNSDYQYSYFGFKKIDPNTCVNLIQTVRNNYIHKANSNNETNGVIWYMFNFLLWLSKKEFKNYFIDFDYIGNKEIIDLFKDE